MSADRAALLRSRRALLDSLQGFSLLEPDAEADACGPSFEAYVRDRMDEWHNALQSWSGRSADSFARAVFVTRSARALAEYAQAHPWGEATTQACRAFDDECARVFASSAEERADIAAVREALEPLFRQSPRWQFVSSVFPESRRVPWLMVVYMQWLWLSLATDRGRPSLMQPWVDLWCRGVWPMPVGEGAVAVWVPRLDEGAGGIDRALRECSSTALQNVSPSAAFTAPCFDQGPGTGGVVFGGYWQVPFDLLPPLTLVPPKIASMHMLSATMNFPAPPPESEGLLARLRRLIRGK